MIQGKYVKMFPSLWKLAAVLATSGLTTAYAHGAIAQIVPDGTLGAESSPGW
jgi:hypothetical protein